MNLDLDTAASEWRFAKAAERKAVERRRELEDHMIVLLGICENLDGTANSQTDGGHKIKITGRMNRKVDSGLAQEIASEHGLEDWLMRLFRWKAEINLKLFMTADTSVTNPFLSAITTAPGRASFAIDKDEPNDIS